MLHKNDERNRDHWREALNTNPSKWNATLENVEETKKKVKTQYKIKWWESDVREIKVQCPKGWK